MDKLVIEINTSEYVKKIPAKMGDQCKAFEVIWFIILFAVVAAGCMITIEMQETINQNSSKSDFSPKVISWLVCLMISVHR